MVQLLRLTYHPLSSYTSAHMKNYELVILLQPQLSKEEHEKTVKEVEDLLKTHGGQIVATDEMGLMTLAHEITKGKLTQAFFLSYHVQLPTDAIQKLKGTFAITKGMVRFAFFSMTASEKFVIYKDINKLWEREEGSKDALVKKGFFADEDKEKLTNINWKSANFLRNYMTRFGDIKPRRFMANRVKQQKKVRIAIIRARELGVLPYTR